MTFGWDFRKYLYRADNGAQMCDKQSPFQEILFRFNAYSKLSVSALRAGIPVSDLIRARYPYYLPEPVKPTMLSIEFCNVCNLACSYCPRYDDPRAKGYMEDKVFDRVIQGILDMNINRIHIRGWGEPTQHPRFADYVARLAKAAKYLDIVTNGQWKDDKVITNLLSAPVHRIDVSVDLGGRQVYETSRRGASYELVLHNLKSLKLIRDHMKSKSTVIVRSMFRPSQADALEKEKALMREFADAVLPAPIFRKTRERNAEQPDEDIYTLTAVQDEYPRCHFPLNQLYVSYDGTIPMCDNLILTHDQGIINVGNVLEKPLQEIWSSDRLRSLRLAHKRNVIPGRTICRGCTTC